MSTAAPCSYALASIAVILTTNNTTTPSTGFAVSNFCCKVVTKSSSQYAFDHILACRPKIRTDSGTASTKWVAKLLT